MRTLYSSYACSPLSHKACFDIGVAALKEGKSALALEWLAQARTNTIGPRVADMDLALATADALLQVSTAYAI